MRRNKISSELQDRIIYGGLAALAALIAILSGGFIFDIFIIMLALLASTEFDRLRGDGKISFLFCIVPILLFHHPLLALALVVIAVLLVMLAQYSAKKNYPWLIISIIYLSLPTISLLWLRALPNGQEVVFWLVMAVVATDVGAYIFGKNFGKNLLAPAISPKKTWEGFGGGVLCAFLVSWIYTGSFNLTLFSIVIAVAAQLSDLMESVIKRSFGVKDTGNFLPGHGGVMDRTDGLALTAPLVALASYYGEMPW